MKRISPALVILALGALPLTAQAIINDCIALAEDSPGESSLNAPLFAAAGSPTERACDQFLSSSATNSGNSCTYFDANNGGPGVYESLFGTSRTGTANPDYSNPGSNEDVSHQGDAPGLAAIEEIWPGESHGSSWHAHSDGSSIGNSPPQILAAPAGLTGDHEFVLDLLFDAGMFSKNDIAFDAAPEAATVILLGLGLYGVGVARRR